MSDLLPTIPQLVRFRKRLDKAMDRLESASNWALDALRVYDGDKVQIKHIPEGTPTATEPLKEHCAIRLAGNHCPVHGGATTLTPPGGTTP